MLSVIKYNLSINSIGGVLGSTEKRAPQCEVWLKITVALSPLGACHEVRETGTTEGLRQRCIKIESIGGVPWSTWNGHQGSHNGILKSNTESIGGVPWSTWKGHHRRSQADVVKMTKILSTKWRERLGCAIGVRISGTIKKSSSNGVLQQLVRNANVKVLVSYKYGQKKSTVNIKWQLTSVTRTDKKKWPELWVCKTPVMVGSVRAK